ncbi:MAG TPA: nickel pincer cofactor biosynthesis protein LarC [Nitrospiraceae bacterium]|nr:nickel pincer cofactor biosynthesis protein LarC [Nitrospiraceae bacterium]
MRIAYFDCFSGISGDMILGAMVDAGLPLNELKRELSKLKLKGYKLKEEKVNRAGLMATKVEILVQKSRVESQARPPIPSGSEAGESRKWRDIENIITASSLSPEIKQKGLKIFKRLFEAESGAHGKQFDKVHLHELGAIDCVIDIIGTLIGLKFLGVEKVYSSAINLGSGTVKTEHGILPVPAPATAGLLRNALVYSSNIPFELTTPTGAVIISSLTESFGPMPYMKVSTIGIGAGNKDFKTQPNILRLFIGGGNATSADDEVTIIETNIDDMSPQIYEHVIDLLFDSGALDVYLTPIIMKKSRPGIKLTVISDNLKAAKLSDIILKETTTFGLRAYQAKRTVLDRETKESDTIYGKVRVKVGKIKGEVLKESPEYEDLKELAKKNRVPLSVILTEITKRRKF